MNRPLAMVGAGLLLGIGSLLPPPAGDSASLVGHFLAVTAIAIVAGWTLLLLRVLVVTFVVNPLKHLRYRLDQLDRLMDQLDDDDDRPDLRTVA